MEKKKELADREDVNKERAKAKVKRIEETKKKRKGTSHVGHTMVLTCGRIVHQITRTGTAIKYADSIQPLEGALEMGTSILNSIKAPKAEAH